MRSRSTAFVPAVFAALTAALVLGLSSGTPQPRAAAGGLKIPQHARDLAARGGRARVIVELKLPAPHVPERRLANAQAIARQRQAIASRAAQVLGKLPPRARRTLHQFVTVPYIALEVTPEGLDALGCGNMDPGKVQKLDAVDQADNLLKIGLSAGEKTKLEHFGSFAQNGASE